MSPIPELCPNGGQNRVAMHTLVRLWRPGASARFMLVDSRPSPGFDAHRVEAPPPVPVNVPTGIRGHVAKAATPRGILA